MRAIIYGAGAIGGVVGGHLALAGHDVLLVGRPGHVNAIHENGLRLITPTGTYALRVPAVTAPEQIEFWPDDAILLCVKSQDTEVALADLSAVTREAPVFCFQNGVRNEETASRRFPEVYGVMVRVGGIYTADGEVTARRDPPGWLVMGCYPSGSDALVEALAANLRSAGFLVKVTADVMPYKWGKLVLNLANAVAAITGAERGDSGRVIGAARQEAAGLLTQAGVPWISQEQLAEEWPEFAEPPRAIVDTDAQSSTWQSLARGRDSVETDFFNGEIVRLAERLGQRAPVNETLLRISQEMARRRQPPGTYTAAQLLALVASA